jgi:uncharacterized repeat protein (TIGR02543 family)
MRQKNTIISVITIALILLLGSCQNLFLSKGKTGNLRLSITNNVSKTIQPGINMNPASYELSGTGPSGATFQKTVSEGTATTIDNLLIGSWTLTVEAKNSEGTSIGIGTVVTTVLAGKTAEVSVIVHPYEGFGSLSLNLTWPAADISKPEIEATLVPMTGASKDIAFSVNQGSAHSDTNQIATGYHTLIIKLNDDGILATGAVEVVRIIKDQTTTGSLVFDKLTKHNGAIDVHMTPELADPLLVSVSGEKEIKEKDKSLTLSASVSGYTESVIYIWYVNGEAKGTGSNFVFGTSNDLGYYHIDVTALSVDGKRAGSSGFATRNVISVTPGIVSLPVGSSIKVQDLKITAGINGDCSPTVGGTFNLGRMTTDPVLAMATTPSGSPVFMNILASGSTNNDLSAHTTATAMVFMGLGLYTGNSALFGSIKESIYNLAETLNLAQVLSDKLAANADVLSLEVPDQQILTALDAALTAASALPELQDTVINSAKGKLKSISINPEIQGGLQLSINQFGQLIATNKKSMWFRALVDGPGVNHIGTSIKPCEFNPLKFWHPYGSEDTIMNPQPLPMPPSGKKYIYKVRMLGGFKSNNIKYFYDTDPDRDEYYKATVLTVFNKVLVPLFNIILGKTMPIPLDLMQQFYPVLDDYCRDIISNISVGYPSINSAVGKLVSGSLKTILDNWNYFVKAITEGIFANTPTPLGLALRVISLTSNGLQIGLSLNDLYATDAANEFSISIGTEKPFHVIYDGNGNTGGIIPVDNIDYYTSSIATIQANTGNLEKSGFHFAGWNTAANGSGTEWAPGSTLTMGSENVILYANWTDGKTYTIGDTGPAGGLIFYDKGSYSDGWRYLEAAPSDQSTGTYWSSDRYAITKVASATGIGDGSTNTEKIVSEWMAGTCPAAELCANLVVGGYDDWFLPSRDELDQMYHNLNEAGLGDFAPALYWSSSVSCYGALFIAAWTQYFVDGWGGDYITDLFAYNIHVRAARAF